MSLNDQIWEWASALKPYQQLLIRQLGRTNSLGSDDLATARLVLLSAHGALDEGTEAPKVASLVREDLPLAAATSGSVRLTAIGELEHVNAVASGQRLEFGTKGLTIVYGDNGSGKSSYARVLKGACRASDRSGDIIPNVFNAPPVAEKVIPRAKIEVDHAGVPGEIDRVTTEPPIAALTTVSVFDAACARAYSDKSNEIAYIPTALTIFSRLATAQDQLVQLLEAELDLEQGTQPRFDEIPGSTVAGQFIAGVTGKTSGKAIAAAVQVCAADEARLAEIVELLAAAARADYPRLAQEVRGRARVARDLRLRLEKLSNGLSAAAVADLKVRLATREETKISAQLLADSVGNQSAIPGVGRGLWKALWEAARTFSHESAFPGRSFPVTEGPDAACVLCHQAIGPDAAARMANFEAFASGAAERLAKDAEKAFTQAVQAFGAIPTISFEPGAPDRLAFTESPAAEAAVASWLAEADKRRKHIESAVRGEADWAAIPESGLPPFDLVEAAAAELEARAVSFDGLAEVEQRAKLEAEARELRAKLALAARTSDIERLAASRARIASFKKAISDLQTTGITRKQTELMKEIVTEGLCARLKHELAAFNLGHINFTIGTKGAKGSTLIEMRLDAESAPKPSAILSEGEQRALALAFFLAEIAMADHDGGIVLDDPVSSMDHHRRDYVARRLVEEATSRQVIVFTHDLSFVTALQCHAQDASIELHPRQVVRTGADVGLPLENLPWAGSNCKSRLGILKQRLHRVRKAVDPDDRVYETKGWLGLLREAWERAVEERVLAGVVERFRPSIRTQQLDRVQADAEAVAEVEAGMTECSNWVHDKAAGLNTAPPTIEELNLMLNRYEAFLAKYKAP